jgi:Carboxypeptidase regulatory-like domain/TonB dependent receptor/TonB-dependent Receptor Plug Domain
MEDIRMGLERNSVGWLRKFGYLALTCFVFMLAASQFAFAQVDEGSITGTVQDATGAVVAGAQVTLVNTDQGITLQTRTSGSGAYAFTPVRVGHYKISATAKGFAKTTQENLVVNVAQTLLVNIQLKLGAATETVEVSTAPPLMQTEEASVGQVVGEEQVNDLPLNGRNFTFLAQLGAGMQTPQADTRGNAASGAFSANGLRPAQNNYLLDGIDNNSNAVDFLNGTNFAVLPPVDAVEEFKVQTADFSAELGRSAGAVMNVSIKSGTNSIHGAAWEFFRNRVLDASDWFEDFNGIPKAAFQQNQFGASIGGPFKKNKLFFFGDYESLHRVEGSVSTGAVPSQLMASSGYTNLSEILAAQAGATPQTDDLGRSIALGTVLDPATTRQVTAGTVDPVTGIVAASSGYVRDPFGYSTCSSAGLTAVTPAACPGLNQLPAGRLDANAIKMLQLYPTPTKTSVANLFSNFSSNPNIFEHRNAYDVKVDYNGSAKDQVFYRFSYVDDPIFIPGIFGGIADGGSFQQGLQTAHSNQSAGAWTHVFNPDTVNVGRVGFNHLHTSRFGPEGTVSGIPAQFGINGIPQSTENGGLGSYDIGGLSTLGSNAFLPSDEISQTLQLTDDFTRIWGKHSFKMGIENQHVKFDTLQPAFSRGNFDYNGQFTDVVNTSSGNLGIAQFLLSPTTATVANGVDYSGGSDGINASNISTTYDYKTYTALYIQDDWKVSPKLTINLGLRWDYFGPIQETNGGQANFVPSALGPPTYLIPATGKDVRTLSSTANNPSLAGDGFLDLLAADGITLDETNKYGRGLLQVQKANFSPRVGFAYQFDPKLVVRGGFGFFYNSFENQGYGPNIGENYPFVFNFSYGAKAPNSNPQATDGVYPIGYNSPWSGCSAASPGGTYTLESGLACIAFTPTQVNAEGLGLQGLQFNYQTPSTLSTNFTVQYSVTRSLSATASYVFTQGAHLQNGIGTNNVSQIYSATHSTSDPISSGINEIPFPDFSQGMSYHATVGDSDYNGLQTKLEWQNAHGLNFLLAYTWSKTDSDAGDLLNGGNTGSDRAPDVPGLGPRFDWGLANFDIRQVLHASGGYQLPFGKGKDFLNNGSKLTDAVVGGWSINWIATLQGGQPLNIGCIDGTAAGLGCNAIKVPGQSQKLGIHLNGDTPPTWLGNPAAFNQACELGVTPATPTGCIPLNGKDALGDEPGQTVTPGFHRLDFSTFKAFQLNERWSMQFRAEFFNILNHPNFNAPGFGGNGVVSIGGSTSFNSTTFGQVGSTRDNPQDPRQIQFALKLYY